LLSHIGRDVAEGLATRILILPLSILLGNSPLGRFVVQPILFGLVSYGIQWAGDCITETHTRSTFPNHMLSSAVMMFQGQSLMGIRHGVWNGVRGADHHVIHRYMQQAWQGTKVFRENFAQGLLLPATLITGVHPVNVGEPLPMPLRMEPGPERAHVFDQLLEQLKVSSEGRDILHGSLKRLPMYDQEGVIHPLLTTRPEFGLTPYRPLTEEIIGYGKIMPECFRARGQYSLGSQWRSLELDHINNHLINEKSELLEYNTAQVGSGFRAPIAFYKNVPFYFLIQGAAIEVGRLEFQPLIEQGSLLIYRGIKNAASYQWRRFDNVPLDVVEAYNQV